MIYKDYFSSICTCSLIGTISRNKFDFILQSFMAHVFLHSPFLCLSYWTMMIPQHTIYYQCQHFVPIQEALCPLYNEVKAKGVG